jgi:hypothetical protein
MPVENTVRFVTIEFTEVLPIASTRGMSLWLLKFSGGSVDDYAI